MLMPGMTVTADIKAGERNMLTYLFARGLPVGPEGANPEIQAPH